MAILFGSMKDFWCKFRLRLPVLALLVFTALFWTVYDRYETVGAPLLVRPSIQQASYVRGAVEELSEGHFRLEAGREGGVSMVHFMLPPAAFEVPAVRVRALMKRDAVELGRHAWSGARVALSQQDEHKRWIPAAHRVLSGYGTHAFESGEEEFVWAENSSFAQLELHMLGSSGAAEFKGLEVLAVRLRPSLPYVKAGFILIWVMTGAYCFGAGRIRSRPLGFLILLNTVAILAGTLMPEHWVKDVGARLEEVAELGLPEKPSPSREQAGSGSGQEIHRESAEPVVVEKKLRFTQARGHFVLFASLCFLVYLSAALERQHASYFFKVAFDIMTFAAVTEVLQHLTETRTAGFEDLLIDLEGMLMAFVLFLCALPVVRWLQRRGSHGAEA